MSLPSAKKLLMASGGANIDRLFAVSLYTEDGNETAYPLTFAPNLWWGKTRGTSDHSLIDSSRGKFRLFSNSAIAQNPAGNAPDGTVKQFRAIGAGYTGPAVNWSFRKAKRFLDIVPYVGNGVQGRQIAHQLGVTPGLIIVKKANGAGDWVTFHRSVGTAAYLALNLDAAASSANAADQFAATNPTGTDFFVGRNLNSLNDLYIAYLFAHDPNPAGNIQCGSYAVTAAGRGARVELGWQPQFILYKNWNIAGDWYMQDDKRGFSTPSPALRANSIQGEQNNGIFKFEIDATGFRQIGMNAAANVIFMAIRKGRT